jgi:two-component system chemotaxis response regulator CheY
MTLKRILVVDDSLAIRQQVGIALREAGYAVTEAEDGAQGLEEIAKGERFSLVICDVNMPRMNGLEMLEALKRSPEHALVPVVMLTTEGQPALIDRAKKAGAKGWIVKPFKAELMLSAVRRIAGP